MCITNYCASNYPSTISYEEQSIKAPNIIEHCVINELNPSQGSGVSAFVLSNPTCQTCTYTYSNICTNLTKHNIPYVSVFYPENNADIWLAALINNIDTPNEKMHADNKRLQLFYFLKEHQQEWAQMEQITDVMALLTKYNVINKNTAETIMSNADYYHNSFLYMKALNVAFNIKGVPSIVICLVLSGEVTWEELQPIITQLQTQYNQLAAKGKLIR